VNLLGDDIVAIKKNAETLIDVSKGVVLEVNEEKVTCYCIITRMWGKTDAINKAKTSLKNFAEFKYLRMTAPKLIYEEIKRRLNSGNVRYHSAQNLLSSRLLFKNIKLEYT
jgi:hypothetical protein